MKTYLVAAKDAAGRRSTFGREAASVEHLRLILEREGFSDIEFIDDEISATLRQQRPAVAIPRSQTELRLEARIRSGLGRGELWWLALRNNAVWLWILPVMAVFGWWSGRGWMAGLALALLLAWVWQVRRGSSDVDAYNELLRTCAVGDWDAAQCLIDHLTTAPTTRENEQLQVDLIFRRAAILARNGQLAAALDLVAPLEHSVHCGGGLYQGRRSSLHYMADDMSAFLDDMDAALRISRDAQPQRLDAAFAQARVGDLAKARKLLSGVVVRNLPVIHRGVFEATQGICAAREGDHKTAILELSTALASLSSFAANPATWPIQGLLAGHLALVLAADGRAAEARAIVAPWAASAMTSMDPANRQQLKSLLGQARALPDRGTA